MQASSRPCCSDSVAVQKEMCFVCPVCHDFWKHFCPQLVRMNHGWMKLERCISIVTTTMQANTFGMYVIKRKKQRFFQCALFPHYVGVQDHNNRTASAWESKISDSWCCVKKFMGVRLYMAFCILKKAKQLHNWLCGKRMLWQNCFQTTLQNKQLRDKVTMMPMQLLPNQRQCITSSKSSWKLGLQRPLMLFWVPIYPGIAKLTLVWERAIWFSYSSGMGSVIVICHRFWTFFPPCTSRMRSSGIDDKK